MEEKKHYKATDVEVEGPFDGWIIEELTPDEVEKEAAIAKENAAKRPQSGGSNKLSPEEVEKKRNEQLNKIKDLINQKRKAKAEAQAQVQTQTQTQSAPAKQAQSAPSQNAVQDTKTEMSKADEEQMLIKKSKETGIPVEVLRMIEEKKKELRARKKSEGAGGNKPAQKKTDNPEGVEMADTVKARREREAAEAYYAQRQERTPAPKKKAPNGEEIGDRVDMQKEEKSHDLYNIMDDVGLDEDR